MGMFEDGIFLPKVGEKRVYKINGIEKKEEANNEKNFKKKGGIDGGFYYLLKTDLGDVILNTWKCYFAMKEADVDIGDTIEIDHTDTGVYNVKKVKETSWEE